MAQCLGIQVGHDFRADFRGTLWDRADDAEQLSVGEATPPAIGYPGLPVETFFAFALALAQGTCGQTIALDAAPPAGTGQGKAPQERVVFIE